MINCSRKKRYELLRKEAIYRGLYEHLKIGYIYEKERLVEMFEFFVEVVNTDYENYSPSGYYPSCDDFRVKIKTSKEIIDKYYPNALQEKLETYIQNEEFEKCIKLNKYI